MLADSIGHANGGLSKDEMKVIYDAGYADGMRAVEDKHCDADGFHNIDGSPSWHAMAVWCQRHADQLRHNERRLSTTSPVTGLARTDRERTEVAAFHPFQTGWQAHDSDGMLTRHAGPSRHRH